MNKLLLIALLGFTLVALTGASSNKENRQPAADSNADLAESRKARSPEKAGNENNQIKNKGRRKKVAKRRKGPSGRRVKKRRGTKMAKRRRGNKRREQKKRKGQRRRAGSKRRTKGKRRRSRKRSQSRNVVARQNANNTCYKNTVLYLKMMINQVANFMSQRKRMMRQNSTGDSKSGKKGAFKSIQNILILISGSNKSKPVCPGGDKASAQIKNLTTLLGKCSEMINKTCNTSNIPQPNVTKVKECKTATDKFKTMVDSCMNMTLNDMIPASCNCFLNPQINTLSKTVRTCVFKNEAAKIANATKMCKEQFSKCRKLEDEGGMAIFNCLQSKGSLLFRLKQLMDTGKKVSEVNGKAKNLAGRLMRALRESDDGLGREKRQTTCGKIISLVDTIITMVEEDKAANITSLANQVTSAGTVTCSNDEKKQITERVKSLDSIESEYQEEIMQIKESLKEQTGATPSDAEINQATSPQPTKSSLRHRRAVEDILKGIRFKN